MLKYVSLGLKFFSLGMVIAAASFWSGSEVTSRPKYRDEQTLVGGAIWTQTLIPVGLIISTIIREELSTLVHAYFLLAGCVLLGATGFTLVVGECRSMTRQRQASITQHPTPINTNQNDNDILREPASLTYDKVYFGIGILALLACCSTLVDLVVVLNM